MRPNLREEVMSWLFGMTWEMMSQLAVELFLKKTQSPSTAFLEECVKEIRMFKIGQSFKRWNSSSLCFRTFKVECVAFLLILE